MYVKEYMNTNVITVNSNTLIHDAEKIMRDNNIRRLPVVDKGKLVGLLTRRKLREARPSPATSLSIWEINYLLAQMKAKDIMEESLFTVTPDTTVEQAVSEAQKRGIGTILVVDKAKPDKLLGIVTTTDLYKLTTRILGFGQPGARLHVLEPTELKSCQEVMDTINKRGVRILSMFHVTPPGVGKEDCIFHLDTEDASQIIEELNRKGYQAQIRTR
jgi:acetoin utilization protein AcuB